jgi:hypothetical protein
MEGRANAQTLARAEGSSDWRRLISFPEFAGAPARTPFPTYTTASRTGLNGLALTGFLLSLFNFVCCCFGPLFSILGLLFSIIALFEIRRDPSQRGRTLAILGIILAVLGFFVSGGAILLWTLGLSR